MLEQALHLLRIDRIRLPRVQWMRWLLPVLVIGLALAIGTYGVRRLLFERTGFELFLLVTLFGIAAVLMLIRLELGILAILMTSFFVQFSLPTGTGTKIPASMVVSMCVCGVWLISMMLRRQVQLAKGYYVKPALLFMLISLVSIPYSWLLFTPDIFGHGGSLRSGISFTFVQLGGVTLMVLLPLVMLMAANVLRQERWFKVLFAVVVIVAVPEFLQRLAGKPLAIGSFSLSTGASYSLWVVALAAGQGLLNPSLKLWQRIPILALAGIWLLYGAEVGATWFSGWMPAFVAMTFLALMRSRWLFFGIALIALVMLSLRWEHYYNTIWLDAVNLDSNRFEIWQVIVFDLTLTKTNILFGAGPAGYLPFYEFYYPTSAWVSHNNYVDIFAETGVVGFSIFLWLLFGIFRTGWEQREQMPSGFLRGFNYGVLAGFVGSLFAMGLGDWFIPFVYNIGIPGFDFAVYGWLFTGAMLALNFLRAPAPQLSAPAPAANA